MTEQQKAAFYGETIAGIEIACYNEFDMYSPDYLTVSRQKELLKNLLESLWINRDEEDQAKEKEAGVDIEIYLKTILNTFNEWLFSVSAKNYLSAQKMQAEIQEECSVICKMLFKFQAEHIENLRNNNPPEKLAFLWNNGTGKQPKNTDKQIKQFLGRTKRK